MLIRYCLLDRLIKMFIGGTHTFVFVYLHVNISYVCVCIFSIHTYIYTAKTHTQLANTMGWDGIQP